MTICNRVFYLCLAVDDTPDVAPKRAGRKPLNEPDATVRIYNKAVSFFS
jgi:hypothetical protein